MILDPEFARNQKIVLINVDQDAILHLRVNYQHVLKKFPNPNDHDSRNKFNPILIKSKLRFLLLGLRAPKMPETTKSCQKLRIAHSA